MARKQDDLHVDDIAIDDIAVDDIVIEEIDIDEIENREQYLKKEDDSLVGSEQTAAAQRDQTDDETDTANAEKSEEDSGERAETENGCGEAGAPAEAAETDSDSQGESDGEGMEDPEIIVVSPARDDERVYSPAEEYSEDDDGEEDDDDDDEEEKPRRKRSKADIVRYIVMFIALGVLVYAVYSLISIFLEYRAGEQIYEDLSKYAVATETPEEQPVQEYIDETDPLNPNFTPAVIDWDALQAENPDVCGWIQFESDSLKDSINYPIVQGTDNSYYLKHTVNLEENSAGSIFIEAQNRSDFSDMNTFVYGHNMKNGSMFGLLRYYKEASYYEGNEFFWIYTPQGNYRYKIFSCYEPHAESETYTWWSDPCDEYTTYLEKVKSYSKYDTGVNVKPTDHIVTLSTCTSRGSDYRFVVHGKLVYSELKQTAAATAETSVTTETPAAAQ